MTQLLDTHTLLWWFVDDPRPSAAARAAITEAANEIMVSAASAWEIATKHRLGKVPEAEGAVTRWRQLLAADDFVVATIRDDHGLRAAAYPVEHRDPFDRILAAQAELDDWTLVTADPAFKLLPVRTLW